MKSETGNITFPIRSGWTRFVQAEWLAVAGIGGYLAFLPFRTSPDLATLSLLVFGLLALNAPGTIRPRIGRLDLAVIAAAILAALLSSLLSDQPLRGLRFTTYVGLNMVLLVLAAAVVSRSRLRVVAFCIGLFGVLHLAVLLVSSRLAGDVGAQWLVDYARLSTLIVPNDALILGLCLPSLAFCLSGARQGPSWKTHAVLIPYVALSIYACHLLQSKIALLSVLAAFFVAAASWALPVRGHWIRAHRTPLVAGAGALLLSLGAAAWALGNRSTTRLSLWADAVSSHDSVSALLFGAGPNTFVFNPFWSTWEFDRGNFIVPWVHNLFLEAYNEQGLFGLSALLLLALLPLWRALQVRDRPLRALLLATTVTFCLVALFEITLTRRFYFAVLALLYGLSAAHAREVSDE